MIAMPIVINNEKYYHTSEACALAGISKNTFLRWVADGDFAEVQYRDGRGWRLFDEKELARLKSEVTRRNSVNSISDTIAGT
jgi:excisionase family DNA binding protein